MPDRIVYLCWPPGEITGGIKLAFRHVEALREAGLDACIATENAQAPTWFQSDAPRIDWSRDVQAGDLLVFPENHPGLLERLASLPGRKVLFCQSLTMAHLGLGAHQDFAELGVSAVLCVSRLATSYCRRRFPGLPTTYVPAFVDERLFHFHRGGHSGSERT
jgi:hypothetical protein